MPRILILLVAAALITIFVASSDGLRPGGSSSEPEPLRGVVLFIGDGMGLASICAARIHSGTLAGLANPATATLTIDHAPQVSLCRTYSTNYLVTDSAASATALLTGQKAPNGSVNCIEQDGQRTDFESIFQIAGARGIATGVVTTTRITHATPASAYAHHPRRYDEEIIAAQLVPGPGNPSLGQGIDVILGGGRRSFVPKRIGAEGRRDDGRDLIEEMSAQGYRTVSSASELQAALTAGAERIFGVFSDSHMSYELDRETKTPEQPKLVDMVAAALEVLRKDEEGYILLVEGGRIDHAQHATNGQRVVGDMLAFDEAIAYALRELGDEALIGVTADHDHSMVVAGYAPVENGIFSEAGKDTSGTPYTTILFANGPGGGEPPSWLDSSTLSDPDFRERAGVPLRSETHGGQDVPLYMWGPEDIIDNVPACIENTQVFEILLTGLDRVQPPPPVTP